MSIGLEEPSKELNISESGLRKRTRTLGIPVEKGAKGKWILSYELAMKDGAGDATIRRIIGFAPDLSRTPESTEHLGLMLVWPSNPPLIKALCGIQ